MRCAAVMIALAGCVTTQPPGSVSVCSGGDCSHPDTMPLFWAGDVVPFQGEELGQLQVNASELAAPGFETPTRDQLIAALARRAKALGADALTQVQVEEAFPMRQPDPTSVMTQVSPPPQGFAKGVAVRHVALPPVSTGTAASGPP